MGDRGLNFKLVSYSMPGIYSSPNSQYTKFQLWSYSKELSTWKTNILFIKTLNNTSRYLQLHKLKGAQVFYNHLDLLHQPSHWFRADSGYAECVSTLTQCNLNVILLWPCVSWMHPGIDQCKLPRAASLSLCVDSECPECHSALT